MPLDPAQRHQIEQDVITATWKIERIAACDDAVALPRKIPNLERDDYSEVILGAAEKGHNDRMARIVIFLLEHDQ